MSPGLRRDDDGGFASEVYKLSINTFKLGAHLCASSLDPVGCSPDEAKRNPGSVLQAAQTPDFASLHPGYVSHTTVLILRSRAKRGVSKDGGIGGLMVRPAMRSIVRKRAKTRSSP